MPISEELLKILCCPLTKKPVNMLSADKLELLNSQIADGKISDKEGNILKESLTEGIITEDSQTIYRIDDNIPVMLAETGIATDQIDGF